MIRINQNELQKAIIIVEDYLFSSSFDNTSPDELKLIKLLKVREKNPRFERDLASMICGNNQSFVYRTSSDLTKYFRYLGYNFSDCGGGRENWVEDVLLQLNIKDISKVIEKGLFNKRDFIAFAQNDKTVANLLYENAIQEFQDFIDSSLNDVDSVDLDLLLNMNVNTELLFNQELETEDEVLNNLIKESKRRFLNPQDKNIALEKIWDAFERVKTYYNEDKKKSLNELLNKISSDLSLSIEDFDEEFKKLTIIGNNYRIRHHEKGKKEIEDKDHIEYLYFRVVTLIDLCIKKINI